MRFLCLPGAFCNAKAFNTQLGLEDFFGPPPNFTFAEVDDPDLINFNILDFPGRDTPEDTMNHGTVNWDLLDTEDDIAGVIGYSEGVKIAATLILEEERRRKQHGRAPRLKCAILVCGWPVLDPETGATILAADEDSDDEGEMITIPTCHVVGAADLSSMRPWPCTMSAIRTPPSCLTMEAGMSFLGESKRWTI
ncbi:hypothetical protein N7474_000639 [Penicillium riverlandense]|uniref:uncharacterized protein n=1 Tax=Penicillium riverlandense TaxID=1903569 RepID=UPI002549246F|nr:uncharacterized protein N7474_000639 [Penicillium riverlandense]KAJ5832328.1 hypothetical protein N7474_000639 [Penicillium riverlandense]